MFKKNLKFLGTENILTVIDKIQASGSIRWAYICIGCIYFMLKGQKILGYTKIIVKMKQIYCIKSVIIIDNFKTLKFHILFFKTLVLSIRWWCGSNDEYLKKKNQLRY